jgi:hypothetical protein
MSTNNAGGGGGGETKPASKAEHTPKSEPI